MNVENLILDALNYTKENLNNVLLIIFILICITWLMVVFWVASDISKRTENKWTKFLSIFGVTFLGIPGLICYLLFRPHLTIEELKESRLYSKKDILLIEQGLRYCKTCFSLNKIDFKYCVDCGENLNFQCKKCYVSVDPTWSHCPYCRYKIPNMIENSKKTGVASKVANKFNGTINVFKFLFRKEKKNTKKRKWLKFPKFSNPINISFGKQPKVTVLQERKAEYKVVKKVAKAK